MTTDKRRKQLAREKYERQQARRAASAQRRRSRQRIVAAVVVAALVIGAGAWIILARLGSSGAPEAAIGATPAASPAATPLVSAAASAIAAAASAADAARTPLDCRPAGTPRPDDRTYAAAPAATDLSKATSAITLTTNCGPITITTLPDKAPRTVASQVFLAQDGFYDRTSCHRVTTAGIFVLQCGDPRGDGKGSPGYTVPDENLPAADGVNYPAGTVAMANAGPGTSGSQFFIVYDDTSLPPGYTVWGTVTEGLDLVRAIAERGVEGGGQDGRPAQPVFIESAAVSPA